MFCPNCGTKALDNAEFCQSCGAKLIVDAVEKKQPETSTWQTQVQPRQYPTGTPEKKKGKKWPIILGVAGVLLCLLVILAVMGGNDSSKNQSQENSTGVNLSETYTNEEEGISFKYPSGWKPLSEEEVNSILDSLENKEYYYYLVMLANENDDKPEEKIYMEVAKFDTTPQELDYFFTDDEKFLSILDEDIFVQDNSIIEIDGVTARRVTYIKGDELGGQCYFYAVGSRLYRIDFNYIWEFAGDKQKFFDAIIDSYKITATETAAVGSDLAQGNRILIGETQNYVGRNGYTDEIEGEFEITLDYVEFADKWNDIYDEINVSNEEYPEQDCIFLCAGITAQNIGKQEGVLDDPTLIYDGEYIFKVSYRREHDMNLDLRYGIPPLSAQTQIYVFQLPNSALESDKPLVLKFSDYDENEKIFFVIREGADGSVSMPGNAGTQQTYESEYMFDIWNLAGEYEGDVMPYSAMYINIYSSPEGDIVGNYNITFPNAGIENKGELRRDADKAFSLISNGTVNGTIEVVNEAIGEIVVRYIDYTQEEEYLEYNYYMYTAYPMP